MEKYLLASMLFIIYNCSFGQVETPISQLDQENILTKKQYELIYEQAKLFPNGTQISIAIIENGDVIFFGAKRENDTTVITDNYNSAFEIGSISKVFTGTLLSNYVMNEKVELDNNINDYLDFPLKDNLEISFIQLATHTSGLPRIPASLDSVSLENPYKDYGEEELKLYLSKNLKMYQKPGEKCEYSNLGGGLLGYVLTKIDDTTYEAMLQENIFSKYKMKSSTTKRNKIKSKLIKGLNDKGNEVPNWDMSVLVGAGGILSSVEDLSKFSLAQFEKSNKELALTRQTHFTVDDNFSMGLGWSVIKTASGAEWNWHNGGTGGYTSSMIIDVKRKNGVIILSNISALGELTNKITSLCPELMNTLE